MPLKPVIYVFECIPRINVNRILCVDAWKFISTIFLLFIFSFYGYAENALDSHWKNIITFTCDRTRAHTEMELSKKSKHQRLNLEDSEVCERFHFIFFTRETTQVTFYYSWTHYLLVSAQFYFDKCRTEHSANKSKNIWLGPPQTSASKD